MYKFCFLSLSLSLSLSITLSLSPLFLTIYSFFFRHILMRKFRNYFFYIYFFSFTSSFFKIHTKISQSALPLSHFLSHARKIVFSLSNPIFSFSFLFSSKFLLSRTAAYDQVKNIVDRHVRSRLSEFLSSFPPAPFSLSFFLYVFHS